MHTYNDIEPIVFERLRRIGIESAKIRRPEWLPIRREGFRQELGNAISDIAVVVFQAMLEKSESFMISR